MKAPAKLRIAAIVTATFGGRAPVAIDVAIALAVSWKPLVKSNANAVTITAITMRVMFILSPPARGISFTIDHTKVALSYSSSPVLWLTPVLGVTGGTFGV